MKTIEELKAFAKSQISNQYTIIDFIETNARFGSEKAGIIVHENIDGDQYTTIGYYDSTRKGSEEFGRISAQITGKYNGQLWDKESENVITGFEIISVTNCDRETYKNYIENDWAECLVNAANGKTFNL